MNTLHILSESPFNAHSFNTALAFIDKNDGIVLTSDAVYFLLAKHLDRLKLEQLSVSIYALEEDLTTRAITLKMDNIMAIDYTKFVDICTQYQKVISWL